MAKQYAYYPGCSMHSSGKDFEESLQAVCRALDLDLQEIADWNCCGASATHLVDHKVSDGLALRNLKLAQGMGVSEVVTACAACYSHLKFGEKAAKESGKIPEGFRARNLLDVMHEDVGIGRLEKMVKRPLAGLKPAAYYGCLMVRPPEVMQMDDAEDPVFMDDIVEALGAERVDWSYKTDCCGGSMSIPRADLVIDMVGNLMEMALEAGANCFVAACPLCMVNLDTRQEAAGAKNGKTYNLPVYYFTELMGIAFGLSEYPKWLRRHIIDGLPLIEGKTAAVS